MATIFTQTKALIHTSIYTHTLLMCIEVMHILTAGRPSCFHSHLFSLSSWTSSFFILSLQYIHILSRLACTWVSHAKLTNKGSWNKSVTCFQPSLHIILNDAVPPPPVSICLLQLGQLWFVFNDVWTSGSFLPSPSTKQRSQLAEQEDENCVPWL